MLTCGLRMRYRFAVTTFSWTSIRTPSPIPRLNRRLTPPGTCAMRLTPGTLSAESRAMVTSTSGETVVFPCEYDSVIVSPYSGGRVERSEDRIETTCPPNYSWSRYAGEHAYSTSEDLTSS